MGSLMRLLAVLILSFAILSFSNPTILTHPDRLLYYSPCDSPIAYRVGSIDGRFNVSLEEFKDSIEQASVIWESTSGKNLFVYDPKAPFSINMIYDTRQALNQQIGELEGDVKTQASQIKPEIAQFERRSAEFKTKVAAFNKTVEYWNSQGGAPKEEYEKIKQEQETLQKESDELNAQAKALNRQTSEYNNDIAQLNQTVTSFNEALSARPEQGLYNPAEQRIDIYITDSAQELVHTLAHELGHAVGLGHMENEKGIMYFATSESVTPAPQEKQILFEICKRRTTLEIGLERASQLYKSLTYER